VDTESIIREALGLLGRMADSPESETILRGLEPEKLTKFESLVAEIEKAETDLQLVTKSHEIICFVEDTEALRKILIQKPREAVVEAEKAKVPSQAKSPMNPSELLAQLTGGGNPLDILQGFATMGEGDTGKSITGEDRERVQKKADECRHVRENQPGIKNTTPPLLSLIRRILGRG